MANESEVIRLQMDETRTSLTDKLEMLEQQVTDTVQGASAAVSESVDSVKEVVKETVQTVKASVKETVASVKETFDLSHHVETRPWTMMAGAAALGFFGGLLTRGNGRRDQTRESDRFPANFTPRGARLPAHGDGGAPQASYAPSSATTEHGVLGNLSEVFHKEINQVKSLAVGTLLGMVRDMVTKAVPGPIEQKVGEVIDDITTKLGGQPVQGPVLKESAEESNGPEREAVAPAGFAPPHRFSGKL
jgi:ElaB/YqjD/DUF883 family membrane-anchored ribosome-binding protein